MQEFVIYPRYGSDTNKYAVRWMTAKSEMVTPSEIPDEIKEAVDVIVNYCENKMSPEEEQRQKILEFLFKNANDQQKLAMVEVFPEWRIEANYKVGDECREGLTLYRSKIDHSASTSTRPTVNHIVWEIVGASTDIPEFEYPKTPDQALVMGDKRRVGETIYMWNLPVPGTYSPTDYPDGWVVVNE